jgi:hypothetical protein
MSSVYAEAESVEKFAKRLIPSFHPDLATARIKYMFVEKASKSKGRVVLGKVRKISGILQYLLNLDFLFEVALDQWNELSGDQREALIDHLLEQCFGEEDEKTGDMKWSVREPDVKEFTSIFKRHGAWHDNLTGFLSVAQEIDIDSIAKDIVENQ